MIRIFRHSIYYFLLFLGVASNSWANCLVSGEDLQLCETREILYQGGDADFLSSKAAGLATPARIYEHLRNNTEYSIYHGARSNTINTFLSLRGNDVDLSSTLIAMFRSQGLKARYAQGNIRITKSQLANWLGVINTELAVSVLRNQGIQNIDDSDPVYVSFEHVWTEVLIKYDQYRGGSPIVDSVCVSESSVCRWVSLDVSFKQKKYKEIHKMLLRNLNFDYEAYYSAQILDSSPNYPLGLKNKSPLEIFEEQALAYLRTNHPGVTLEDVIDSGEIIKDESGLLPASLPFDVVGSITRYDSVEDHDNASTENWTKYLTSTVTHSACGNIFGLLPTVTLPITELSTNQLTVTVFNTEGSTIFGHRLDGEQVGSSVTAGSITCNGVELVVGTKVSLALTVDVAPGVDPISVTYSDLMIGGYYLVAAGGETSNITQVRRAYKNLLAANDTYSVIIDETGMIGIPGTPFVDKNANGIVDVSDVPLIDDLDAQDALTGGLLYVAQSLYYTRFREEGERYSRLKGIISPVSAYIGVVSTTHEVEYLDNVPFAITPGGLLIDLKGIRLNGSWEIDQPAVYSNETFKILGHIGSSLEHEIWQTITGYDAISTVRGIQFALEQGKSLLEIKNDGQVNTFPASVSSLGFSGDAPANFVKREYSNIFGRRLVSWDYSGTEGATDAFHVFRADIGGLTAENNNTVLVTYNADNGIDDFFSNYDNFENQLITDVATEGQLKTNLSFQNLSSNYQTYDVLSANVTSPTGFAVGGYSRTNSLQYEYIINETTQHTDGDYVVTILAQVADNTDVETFKYSGLGAYAINSVVVTSPATFKVNSYTQPDANGDVYIDVGKNGTPSNNTHTIEFEFTLQQNSNIFTATPSASITVVLSRFLDGTMTITTGAIDVSDDQTITCPGGLNGEDVIYTAAPSQLVVDLENCFNNKINISEINNFVDFFDRDKGFNSNDYVYRNTSRLIDEYDIEFVRQIRDEMYLVSGGWYEYIMPSRLPQDSNYLFGVYLKNTYNLDNDLASSTYAIVNHSNRLTSGGEYVTAEETIDPATSDDFNNSVFTDLSLVSVSNNDLVKTPSTSDPVSTVTGNMYHDETDIVIKNRGNLNYAFTRTYNSDQSSNDSSLGFGWSHSYGMRLKSNDYGQYPNYPPSEAPENGNGITSSISYVDERGGEHIYLINESNYAVTSPNGEYDTLQLDTPIVGQFTLSFRNGIKYVFEGSGLKSTPGQTARLAYIEDPYNNRLNLGYDVSGRLISVQDNLDINGRTGLIFTYNGASQHIQNVSDWTSRTWSYLYDTNGNLISAINPLNHTRTYSYHTDTHLLHELEKPAIRNGKSWKMAFTYYENDQAYDYTNTLGEAESLSYDLFRKRTRVTDPRGNAMEHYYDENGALIKMTEKDNGILLFKNTEDELRYSKTNALGFETKYSYKANRITDEIASDNFGRVSRETDALNNNVDFDYGLFDQPVTTTDKRGNSTTHVYYQATNSNNDAVQGKLSEIIIPDPSGPTILVQYLYYADLAHSAFGQLKQKIEYFEANNTPKRMTHFTYTADGINLQSMTVIGAETGNSITTSFTYDILGRKISETVQRRTSVQNPTLINITTSYEYDDLNRVTKVTNPRGDIKETIFDANGKIVQEKVHYLTNQTKANCTGPQNGYVTCIYVTNTYDAADRLISTADILENVTSFQYDENGNLISQTDANNHITRYEYDAMNRRTAIINANGYRSEFVYDLAGRMIATKDPSGNVTRFEYDVLGQQTKVITPLGYETQYVYDENGNVIQTIDANAIADPINHPRNYQGVSESRTYDELNRLITQLDAQLGETEYTYDFLGNVTAIVDPEGQATIFAYDDLGRIVATIDPIIETPFDEYGMIMLYDEIGNVLVSQDREARVREHTYDVLNRLVSIEYIQYLVGNTQETYTYDTFGNLVKVENNDVTYTYTYTTKHQVASKTDSRLNKTLSWTYDAVGNVATKTDYQGDVTHFQYDSSNRLVAQKNSAYLQVSYHYDPAGRLLNRILSNGAKTHYRYDNDGRLVSLKNISASGSVVEDIAYQHDAIGNIIQQSDSVSGRNVTYTYDGLYRLVNVDSTDDREDRIYVYDAVGNRKVMLGLGMAYYYSYNPAGFDSPPLGNRLLDIRMGYPTGPLHRQFSYDNSGRITQKKDGGGNPIYTISYNGKGRASLITTDTATNSFEYDPNDYRIQKDAKLYHLEGEHLEATYNATGQLQSKYMRGVVIDEIVNGYDYPTSNPADKVNVTYHHDQLNSVTALTGHAGATEATVSYDVFGKPLSETGSVSNDMLFTGREYDRDSGLYYYRARYYDPEIGRFTSEDPLGFNAGINFYVYVNNNPINLNDPTGMEPPENIPPSVDIVANIEEARNMTALEFYNAVKTGGKGLQNNNLPNLVLDRN